MIASGIARKQVWLLIVMTVIDEGFVSGQSRRRWCQPPRLLSNRQAKGLHTAEQRGTRFGSRLVHLWKGEKHTNILSGWKPFYEAFPSWACKRVAMIMSSQVFADLLFGAIHIEVEFCAPYWSFVLMTPKSQDIGQPGFTIAERQRFSKILAEYEFLQLCHSLETSSLNPFMPILLPAQ